MGLRKYARAIVAARAERDAERARGRVKAPGKFRRFLFAQGWEKARKTWWVNTGHSEVTS